MVDTLVLPAQSSRSAEHWTDPEASLPLQWPQEIASSVAWVGEDYKDEKSYLVTLSSDEVEEIELALAAFRGSQLGGHEISPATFPLPTMAHKLRRLAIEVHRGRGFFVLRGLDSEKYSAGDNALIFLGVSSYIGKSRGAQTAEREVFAHITNSKHMVEPQPDRPPKVSKLGMTFHNDAFCDILAMQVRACAIRNGRHKLASVANVYNKLALSRPDLLRCLSAPEWDFHRESPHALAEQRSLIYYHEGHTLLHFVREPLAGLNPDCRFQIPCQVTDEQRKALDAVEAIARHDELVLTLHPGDLTFVNNFGIIHSREAWHDEQNANPRYLVRLWLKNEELAWKLPPSIERGNRAIYGLAEDKMIWNYLPAPKLTFQLPELFSP